MQAAAEIGVAEAFRQPDAAKLSVRALQKASLAVTEIRLDRDGFGLTDPIPYTDATMLAVQLRAIPFHEAMTDNKPVPVYDIRPGDTLFYDMRHDPRANVLTPSHSLHFVLPRPLLDQIADEAGAGHIDEFTPRTGVAVRDRSLARLARAILPALRNPDDATTLFASHFLLALGYYAASRYGGLPLPEAAAEELEPIRARIAMELMSARLNGDLELSELGALTGMPSRKFMIAFRRSTGMAPHQWLTLRRLDLAKSLLRKNARCLKEVAALCGFADQSQLQRVFKQSTGVSPLRWRDIALH